VARKLPGLQRVLGAPSLFSVAYGEIASSIYFALGIIAFYALGFTPVVLLGAGVVFVLVALSYAEGTTAIPETGGAATFVRKAFNDLGGFVTGWAIFLDYLIVIALSALFLPHYVAGALQVEGLTENPWDVVVASLVILAVVVVRIVRRPSIYTAAIGVAVLDLVTQLMLVLLGFSLVFSGDALTSGLDLGSHPTWDDVAFAIPLAMLAYTGLETLANLAEEAKRPGIDLPRSLFAAIGTVVTLYVAIALVGLSAFPAPKGGETALGTEWLRAPLVGIATEIGHEIPTLLAHALRFFVGLTGALILLASITTSMSGLSRLAYSLGEHGMLPAAFGRLHRRTLVSPHALAAAAACAIAVLVATSFIEDDVAYLASIFSFGVLLAFTAAQVAVIRLRVVQPELARPYRVPLDIRIRGHEIPLPAVVGATLTFAIWLVAIATHPGARYFGPLWLVAGLGVYWLVRRRRGDRLTARVLSPDEQVFAESAYSKILVPMKLGLIGEEMLATAVRLAEESGGTVRALHVIRVPLDKAIDASMEEAEARAEASLAEAMALGEEHGVNVEGKTVRARSIGAAIVEEAEEWGADLIVLGSAPRWRRQSRFFSPTVEYVLRKAPCEVLIVAFPQNVIEEESAALTT
jgi:basic amino acid/polyamine antiporter, APA family